MNDRRIRDGHNDWSIKPAIDGCVDAGFWPSDDGRYVMTTEPVFVYGAKTVRIVVLPRTYGDAS